MQVLKPLSAAAVGSLLCGLAALLPPALPPAQAVPAVLTQDNDNARTGQNTQETKLTHANVNVHTFGKLFTRRLDANVNGQVLYVPNLTVNGAAHNVIFAYTSNNADGSPCSLYAFDADDAAQSAPLWHRPLTASARWTTATPVIDLQTNTLFVLTKPNDDNGPTHLRAFSLLTGQEKPGSPITLMASVPGTGDGTKNGHVLFRTSHANDRAALLLLNGVVYAAFAHNSDSFPYQGWIFGYRYDGAKFTKTALFCADPNGGDAGIWQAGKGLAADNSGNIYCSVGNGTFDANSGGKDYGMCYLKLRASTLKVVDYFAPYNEQSLSDQDLDLGNSGPLLIPNTNRLFGGGTKYGSVYLLDRSNMGKFTPNGPDNVVQEFNGVTGNDKVGQNGVCWDAGKYKYVYLWAHDSPLYAFRYDPTAGKFNPAGAFAQHNNTNGGSLCVTSNGTANGIVWAIANNAVFHAYNASDVSQQLWDSNENAARDSIGSAGHFQFPTVVNGKAYVPTGSASIVVYGLLP